MAKCIVAGAIGNCVHVAGVVRFLQIAEEMGYQTHFLGAAVSSEDFIQAIKTYQPEMVGVSYRLTPEVGDCLLREFISGISAAGLAQRKFVFGGTPPVCRKAEASGFFTRCFDGLENQQEVWRFLGGEAADLEAVPASSLLARIKESHPYPLLRHHFGLPSLQDTVAGVRQIAEAGLVDIISLAPDQNAQESFFRPKEMDPRLDGAGGVPLRSADDLAAIYQASQTGNQPLLRVYSGTRDLLAWAELARKSIHNAWGAIPLCWYNALDGRSPRSPETAIQENQAAMAWYGARNIPLEVNEAHHWSLRDAHDTIAVVMAYLAAYNAKQAGVKSYIAQYMFNTPPMISAPMDLAKMLAKISLIESLHDANFTSFRQVRAGLLHLSPHLNVAKGQLAASTMLAMQLKPQIIHVVGFCEGDHAATPDDVLESCAIVQGVLKNCQGGLPEAMADPRICSRRDHLLREAACLIQGIKDLARGEEDPLTCPRILAEAIRLGLLDAPHLRGNCFAAGQLATRPVEGGIDAWHQDENRVIFEAERLTIIQQGKFLDRQEIFA